MSPEKFNQTINLNENSIRKTSPYRNSPRSDKALKKSDIHKITMFLKTLEMLAIHWNIIAPNSYRYRIKKIPDMTYEMSVIPRQIKESYFYHIKTLAL